MEYSKIAIALLLAFVVISVFYGAFHARKSQKRDKENGRLDKENEQLRRQITELEIKVDALKNRHLTANGGLPREVKQKLEDIRAKMSMIDDPFDEAITRFQDLKREIENLMHRR